MYEPIYNHIDTHFEEHLERARQLLRQPSVSLTSDFSDQNVRKCADMVCRYISELGTERVQLVKFEKGYPAIFGFLRSRNPRAKTLVLYGFYDVMPADEPEWRVPPFAADIVDPEIIGVPSFFGKCLVARGANHPKAPLMGFINALKATKEATGDLPVNIMFAVEGEEEIASPNLPEFRNRFIEDLKKADGVYFPLPAQALDPEGAHEFRLGYKGMLPIELRIQGGDWGGPTRSLSLADVAWVDAPAWRLAWALSTLRDPDGKISIGGFYDDVRPPTPEEASLLRGLEEGFDEERTKRGLGISKFRGGKSGKELFADYVMGPQLNIDGLVSGYTGPQVKTTLPAEAVAKMDITLVPNMQSKDIVAKLRRHLDKHGFPEVQIHTYGGYPWARTSIKEDVVQAAMRATETHGVRNAPWPTAVYCAPFSVFTESPLNLPSVAAGMGRRGNGHVANEYLTVDGLRLYEKWVVTFLHEYAKRQ